MLMAHDPARAARFGGLVIVDSPTRTKAMLRRWLTKEHGAKTFGGSRGVAHDKTLRSRLRRPLFFDDLDSLLARFHLRPPQKCENSYIVDHIARHSIRAWRRAEADAASDRSVDWRGYSGWAPSAEEGLVGDARSSPDDGSVDESPPPRFSWKFDPAINAKTVFVVSEEAAPARERKVLARPESAAGQSLEELAAELARADREHQLEVFANSLSRVRCRCTLFVGQRSIFFSGDGNPVAEHTIRQSRAQAASSGGRGACPIVEIPDCAHHIMLDQPLAFVAALKACLGEWQRQDAVEGLGNGRVDNGEEERRRALSRAGAAARAPGRSRL